MGRGAINRLPQIILKWVMENNARCGRVEWVIDDQGSGRASLDRSGGNSGASSPIVLRHVGTGRAWPIRDRLAWEELKKRYLESGRALWPVCPYCRIPIRPARLNHHLGRCPKRHLPVEQANATNEPSSRNRRSAPRDAEERGSNRRGLTSEERGYGDPLDATKGVGFLAREHGRFGSHPGHDGYGDDDNA